MAEGVGIGLGLIRYLVINRPRLFPGDDGWHDRFGLSDREQERILGLDGDIQGCRVVRRAGA